MSISHLEQGESGRRSVPGSHTSRSRRRIVAAVLSPLVASAGLVGMASPASAAVTEVTPPHDIGVFPMRDFLGIGGWGVGAEMRVNVIRDGVQIGSSDKMTLAEDAELNGFAEVNHPGGVCWNGVTPDLVAGDRIEAVDALGNGEFTVVQNVEVTQPATKIDADNDGVKDDVIARGMAANVAGTGRIDPSLVEQRVINPDLKNVPAIDRRDVRAIFGAGGVADGVETLGQIRWDNPTDLADPRWTATYLNLGEQVADLVVAGQSRMLAWERFDGVNRIGMTLWEYGESGGPGMGGCPAAQEYSVGGATPANVNTITRAQENVTLTGTAFNVDSVSVQVDDHDPSTSAVVAEPTAVTIAKPASTDRAVQADLPGRTTWTATIPMSALLALKDDTLVASAKFGRVTDTIESQDTDNDPNTPPVPVVTGRTSAQIGGSDLNILKDLTVPAKPTAFPGVDGTTTRFTTAQKVTLDPINEVEDVVRYRIGTATGPEPTAASPKFVNPIDITDTTQPTVVKARSFDAAGNPSALSTFTYVIGANTVAPAPTGVSAVAANASATVVWTPPTSDGGQPITSWRVQVFQGTSTTPLRTVTVTDPDPTLNPGELSASIGTLTNGTAYRFRVAAFNGVTGTLNYSALTTPVTPAGANAAPTVTAQSPALSATGIAVGSNVTATFSEAVQGVSGTTFTLRNAATGAAVTSAVTYNATSRVATLNPGANLAAGTQYTATLTGGATQIRDTAGAALATTSWSFTTAPAANVAPTITGRNPVINGTGFARNGNPTVTFSEIVQGVSGTTVRLTNANSGAAITSVVSGNNTRTATINPNASLVASTLYRVTLTTNATTGIRDTAGAPLAAGQTLTWTFRTGTAL